MEALVRFYDHLTENELQEVDYNELLFRGRRVLKRKEEDFENLLISSSFSAWQMLSAQGIIKTNWRAYLKKLHLLREEKVTKEELKRDVVKALNNSNRIIEKAKLMQEKAKQTKEGRK